MKKILFIIGSLRRNSFNLQLSQAAACFLGGKAEIQTLDYRALPFVNQDIEAPVPEEVRKVRRAVSEADGIWIFAPEYNHSYSAVLKNLMDWISRPVVPGDRKSGTAAAGKKVTFSSVAGKSAGADVRAKLTELAMRLHMETLSGPETGVALEGADFSLDTLPLTEENKKTLEAQAEAFLEFMNR